MKVIPVYYVPVSPKDKPWITPLIKHLIHKRWDAFRRKDFARYNELKLLVQRKITKAKSDWVNKLNKPADLWHKVDHFNSRNKTSSIDNLHNLYTNTKDLCDSINSTFCNNFSVSNKQTVESIISDCNSFYETDWDFIISDDDVYYQLSHLDSKKAFGSDLVPTFVYKISADIIANPLARIYNSCISSSYFPLAWKEAHIVPTPKCYNASINDLRPISLLCIPSKIFERLVFNSVQSIFYSNFDSAQFGFRKNSSTSCALIKLHDHITKYYDNPVVAGIQVFALDYRLAFDCLNHNNIIRKLVRCNFPVSFIKLIFSYLHNRSQRVRLNNILSDLDFVTSGVPQGSIMRPSLFLFVMADLHRIKNSTCLVKFADDISLSIPIFYSCNNVVEEIENIKHRSLSVSLNLNLKKCKYLFVSCSRNSEPIVIPDFTFCTSLKLLGVYFCNNLKWDVHINSILVSASRRAYAFRVLKPNLSRLEIVQVYKSLVLSVLEYCAPLFVGLNKKNFKIINSIQRKFHNIACFSNCKCTLFSDIHIRRQDYSTKLFLNAHSDPNHLLHSIILCKRTFFSQPYCRSELRKCSFVPYTTEIVNAQSSRTETKLDSLVN